MISIIIPFKYDSDHRLENIINLLKYIKNYWKFEKLILVEMDSNPKIINLLPEWCDYIFVKEKANEWSRSKRVNMAMPLLNSEITMILDSDVIIDESVLEVLKSKILKKEIDAATPFSELFHVSRLCVLEEMQKNKIDVISFLNKNSKNVSRKFKVSGGCFLTRTNIFKHVRGMSELFHGWGWEDDELINKYVKLGYKYVRVNNIPAIHINHERSKNCFPDINHYELSITEKNRVMLMDRKQTMEYYGIQEKPGLYCELTKPMVADTEILENLVREEKKLYSTNEKSTEYRI